MFPVIKIFIRIIPPLTTPNFDSRLLIPARNCQPAPFSDYVQTGPLRGHDVDGAAWGLGRNLTDEYSKWNDLFRPWLEIGALRPAKDAVRVGAARRRRRNNRQERRSPRILRRSILLAHLYICKAIGRYYWRGAGVRMSEGSWIDQIVHNLYEGFSIGCQILAASITTGKFFRAAGPLNYMKS